MHIFMCATQHTHMHIQHYHAPHMLISVNKHWRNHKHIHSKRVRCIASTVGSDGELKPALFYLLHDLEKSRIRREARERVLGSKASVSTASSNHIGSHSMSSNANNTGLMGGVCRQTNTDLTTMSSIEVYRRNSALDYDSETDSGSDDFGF